jgi:hypothetical protein
VIVWPDEQKLDALDTLARETVIPFLQIAKFLHMKVKKER